MDTIDYLSISMLVLVSWLIISLGISDLCESIESSNELIINQKIESYECEIEYITKKKNTLMLICLEQKKKRPNKHLLDSLEVSYYLD